MAHSRPVAILTGAATGVGAACAKTLAAKGYCVLINYQASADAVEAVAAECRASGAPAIAIIAKRGGAAGAAS